MMSTVPHSPLARRPLAAAPNPAGPPVPTCPPRVSEVNTGVGGVILGFPDRFCARFESAPGEREERRPSPRYADVLELHSVETGKTFLRAAAGARSRGQQGEFIPEDLLHIPNSRGWCQVVDRIATLVEFKTRVEHRD